MGEKDKNPLPPEVLISHIQHININFYKYKLSILQLILSYYDTAHFISFIFSASKLYEKLWNKEFK